MKHDTNLLFFPFYIYNFIFDKVQIIKNLIIFANIQEIKLHFTKLNLLPIMTLGAIPFMGISWFLSYFFFYNIIKSYKNITIKGNKR